MEFKLPDIHELSVDVDGELFVGSWYIILNDMVVNYNGFTASTPERTTDGDDVAVSMLRDLIAKHYARLESIPTEIPHAIRLAAHRYINSLDEETAVSDFVASFGESETEAAIRQQLSWLCVNALSMIVPAWKHRCDGNAAEDTFNDLQQWLQDPMHRVDWQTVTIPAVALRNGNRVGDCDACRLEPIADAVANAARYLRSAGTANVTACLLSASYAYAEACHSRDTPDRFEEWLVFEALQPSLESKPLDRVA